MVLKRFPLRHLLRSLFENDVKMYGTQAGEENAIKHISFENDVKMYGTQAVNTWKLYRLIV